MVEEFELLVALHEDGNLTVDRALRACGSDAERLHAHRETALRLAAEEASKYDGGRGAFCRDIAKVCADGMAAVIDRAVPPPPVTGCRLHVTSGEAELQRSVELPGTPRVGDLIELSGGVVLEVWQLRWQVGSAGSRLIVDCAYVDGHSYEMPQLKDAGFEQQPEE
jgi:hypothetical protein